MLGRGLVGAALGTRLGRRVGLGAAQQMAWQVCTLHRARRLLRFGTRPRRQRPPSLKKAPQVAFTPVQQRRWHCPGRQVLLAEKDGRMPVRHTLEAREAQSRHSSRPASVGLSVLGASVTAGEGDWNGALEGVAAGTVQSTRRTGSWVSAI